MGKVLLKSITFFLFYTLVIASLTPCVLKTNIEELSQGMCIRCFKLEFCRNRFKINCTGRTEFDEDTYKRCLSAEGECDEPGLFPVKDEPALFYSCTYDSRENEFTRKFLACSADRLFDSATRQCLDDAEMKAAKHFRMNLLRRDLSPKVDCRGLAVVPDPDSCKAFHVCRPLLKPRKQYCSVQHYFNEELRTCTKEITPECAEKIEKQKDIQKSEASAAHRSVKMYFEKLESICGYEDYLTLVKSEHEKSKCARFIKEHLQSTFTVLKDLQILLDSEGTDDYEKSLDYWELRRTVEEMERLQSKVESYLDKGRIPRKVSIALEMLKYEGLYVLRTYL